MKLKYCKKCDKELPINNFGKDKYSHDEHSHYCKKCMAIRSKKYREIRVEEAKLKFKEYSKNYRNTHKEHCKEIKAIWISKNRERFLQIKKDDYMKNLERYKQRNKEWREGHKEEKQIMDKHYYENNKLKILQHSKEYYKKNKELHKERRKQYHHIYSQTKHGKLKILINVEKRRVLKMQLPYDYSIEEWNDCIKYFNRKCCYCGKEVKLTQDHYIALSKGGEYTKNNIVPACLSCNSSKSNNEAKKWFENQPFYNKKRQTKILKYLHYENNVQQLGISLVK